MTTTKTKTKTKTPTKKPSKAKVDKTTTPSAGITAGKVEELPLTKIDTSDTTFRFRADLRIGPLVESIKAEGIQIPVVLRKQGKGTFQIISGFRRITAARKAGLTAVPAIVRDLSDEEAFKASVLENTNRKTYSDIDRANVVAEYRRRGFTGGDDVPLAVLGLTKRQQRNLLSLLKLPKTVQEAVDDPEQGFSSTHALTLRHAKAKYLKLDYATWIKRVNDEGLSVAQLKRAVNKAHGGDGAGKASGFTGLFRDDGTNAKKGQFRFNPVAVDVGKMTDEEKGALKAELEKVLAKL